MSQKQERHQTRSGKPLNIAVIHPDLGIGGAERLMVDLAISLKTLHKTENKVTIYTSHCDPTHCFDEVNPITGQFKVNVYGDFLPRLFLGHFAIVFAFLRQLYLVFKMILLGEIFQYDLIVLDQLSYCIPLLHLFKAKNSAVLFYCHFPDKLLALHHSLIRKIYRFTFDKIEEWSTSCSDKIVVNSEFTMQTVKKTMPMLAEEPIGVVYPCVPDELDINDDAVTEVSDFFKDSGFFMSINRFDGRKRVDIAIKAFANYIKQTNDTKQKLVIAGGYDARVFENKRCLDSLEELCDSLDLAHITVRGKLLVSPKNIQVYFLPSVSTKLKNALLSKTDMLLYTPDFEHFGIVPLEAFVLGKPVLAHNTGGPLETIVNYFDDKTKFTGFNVEHDAEKWSDVLELVKSLSDVELKELSARCKRRVDEGFSFESMTHVMEKEIDEMKPREFVWEKVVKVGAIAFPVLVVALLLV